MSRKEIPTTDLEDFALSGEEPTPEFRLHLFRQLSALLYRGVVLIACSFKRKQVQQRHHDSLLKPTEAAKRLGVSRQYFYDHEETLPFTFRLPSGALRISENGMERWAANRLSEPTNCLYTNKKER